MSNLDATMIGSLPYSNCHIFLFFIHKLCSEHCFLHLTLIYDVDGNGDDEFCLMYLLLTLAAAYKDIR